MIKAWCWSKSLGEATWRGLGIWHLRDGRGRDRATIWENAKDRFTWHTWDDQGTGGENDEASSLDDAKRHCVAAIVRQGWAPGGWTVEW
jgi:hypothetical protein